MRVRAWSACPACRPSTVTAGQTVFLVGAIALNVGIVYWALHRGATTNGYGVQLLTALGIGLVAGFIITGVSWVLLELVFPNSIAEMRQGAIAWMDAQDMSEAEYQRQLTALDNTTAWSQSSVS